VCVPLLNILYINREFGPEVGALVLSYLYLIAKVGSMFLIFREDATVGKII